MSRAPGGSGQLCPRTQTGRGVTPAAPCTLLWAPGLWARREMPILKAIRCGQAGLLTQGLPRRARDVLGWQGVEGLCRASCVVSVIRAKLSLCCHELFLRERWKSKGSQ